MRFRYQRFWERGHVHDVAHNIFVSLYYIGSEDEKITGMVYVLGKYGGDYISNRKLGFGCHKLVWWNYNWDFFSYAQ